MSLYLGIAILLFLLLFFSSKEGFYSDTNITTAIDDLKAFNKKLDTLKTTMNGFKTSNLSSMDAVTSVGKVLRTKDNALYTAGVVTRVNEIKLELDLYQANVMLLNDTLLTIPKSVIVDQYDETDKEKKRIIKMSLSDAIENLTEKANKISNTLNKIPDS